MKMQYDKKEDAMWIEFASGTYAKTRKVSDVILVDEDENGKILGIEILDASRTIPEFDPNKLSVKVQA